MEIIQAVGPTGHKLKGLGLFTALPTIPPWGDEWVSSQANVRQLSLSPLFIYILFILTF